MKIVKAQKMIKRLKGEIAELQQRISSTLSTLEENEYESDFKTLMATLDEKVEKLITLKVRVMERNIASGMFATILNLGEMKSRMEFLRGLNPVTGAVRGGYGQTEKDKYKSQLKPAEKTALIEACQRWINSMTDKLDDFNSETGLGEGVVRVTMQPDLTMKPPVE